MKAAGIAMDRQGATGGTFEQMTSSASATWRPDREVRLIAGTPPGGGQDRPARALIELLAAQRLVEQPIELVNIPGRGGGNGWDRLVQHRGDPHVLAINSPTIISNQLLGVSRLTYDDLTPIANLYSEYPAFVVRADSPLADGRDLVRALGADASKVRIALATALGNPNHIALAQVTEHAGGDIGALGIDVFDSAPDAIAHVLAGKAALGVITAVSAAPQMRDGSVRTLAVSAPRRLNGVFAQAPTWNEIGVACEIGMWRGLIAPADIPPAARAYWIETLTAVTATAAWKAVLAEKFWADTFATGEDLRAFLDREHALTASKLGQLGLLP